MVLIDFHQSNEIVVYFNELFFAQSERNSVRKISYVNYVWAVCVCAMQCICLLYLECTQQFDYHDEQ